MMNRLDHLRAEMDSHGLDALIVPHADEYQNEYLPASAERLAWLTGFTGSYGLALIFMDKAFIFVDGRYTVQVRNEVNVRQIKPVHLGEQKFIGWLAQHLPVKTRLGYDPALHTIQDVQALVRVCRTHQADLIACEENLVDAIWVGRPRLRPQPATHHPRKHSGIGTAQKMTAIAATLKKDRIDACVLTRPDSVCWLLNVRGADIPYNPLVLSRAVIYANGTVDWFVDPAKASLRFLKGLDASVTVHREDDFSSALQQLAGRRIGLDIEATPHAIAQDIENAGGSYVHYRDPCAIPKACKNTIEAKGMKDAHRRDGVAVVKFLCWLAQQAGRKNLTEIAAADQLEKIRARDPLYRGASFPTISALGAHGAVVHYRATPDSNRTFKSGDIYLVDSGGQYLDGTTDITRTVVFGSKAPATDVCDHFTRVLKGHMALARAHFPAGTTGAALDILARQFLWEAGLDYDHGTGHGVGSYLCVHEGPQRFSKRGGDVALQDGMVLSNEPGFYKEGSHGIRLENLVLVRTAEKKNWLVFDTLTLAPFDRRLLQVDALSAEEKKWLNAYHKTVFKTLQPYLTRAEIRWLEQATAPL